MEYRELELCLSELNILTDDIIQSYDNWVLVDSILNSETPWETNIDNKIAILVSFGLEAIYKSNIPSKYSNISEFIVSGLNEIQSDKCSKQTSGCVYCVEYDGGVCKIGATRNVDRRIDELRAFSPIKITAVTYKYFTHPFLIERILHNKYKDYRKHNEFFNISLLDVDRELENMWARFEAHARGQTMRRINENKEI